MEFFRRTIAQIKRQLEGLTTSQRMVIVLLLVIMVGAIGWMIKYAGQREMVVLLNQSFDEASRTRIINKLEGWEEPYRISGDRILVPAARHKALIAKLSYAEALPEDTSAGWASMLADTDIWTPESVRESKKRIILQNELAGTVALFPGVDKAEVFINEGSKRRLMNIAPVATASVNVVMRPGTGPSRKLAGAIAAAVSGAVNNLRRENVKVIIDGRLISIAPEGQDLSTEFLELKASIEEYLRDKIVKQLPIPNVLVQVDAAPNVTSRNVTKRTYATEGEGSWLAKVETSEHGEESEMADVQQEPGLMANVPDQAPPAPATTQSESLEDATQRNMPFAGETQTTETTGPGGYDDLTVAVSVPLEYFEEMARQRNGDSENEPDAAAVQALMGEHLPRIKRQVMGSVRLISPQDDERVVVDTYWAGAFELQARQAELTAAGTAGGGLSVGSLAGRYGKHIAVSALAMVSLLMMLMMVRKAAGPVEMTEEEAATMMMRGGQPPADALSVEDSNLVDEEGGPSILQGMELGDEVVKTHQILQQIREMVQESPDIAANLISKWIAQDN